MNNLPVHEFAYDKIGSFRMINPFTIAFVYPKNGKPCVIKGGLLDVMRHIKENYPICFVHKTMWHHGIKRTNYCFIGFPKYLAIHLHDVRFALNAARSAYQYERHYEEPIRWKLSVSKSDGVWIRDCIYKKYMKKPPRSWIKELDQFLAPVMKG